MIILTAFILSVTTPVYPGDSIQDALDSSTQGDTVLVMPGTYQGTGEHLVSLTTEHNGIVLLGDEQDPTQVILSGDSLSDSIIDADCTGTSPLDSTMVISGFTFQNGNASVDAFGGAIHTKHCSPLIKNSRFIQCSADNGAAMYVWKGSALIQNCLFQDNECASAGAGIYLYNAGGSINSCVFQSNKSWDDGGGIYCYHSSPTIFNCLFTDGYAHDDGGGIYCYALSDPEISFCTFYNNFALYTGSAVYFRVNSSPVLHHNIATANEAPAFYIQDGGNPVFMYNDVWGNPDGNYGNLPDPTGTAGNISTDPLFTANFFLSQTQAGQTRQSPCVDAGDAPPADYNLEMYWTRTDSVPDSVTVDMGYHHGPDTLWQSSPPNPQTSQLNIYPNPTYGSVSVVLPATGSYNLLEVYDLSGRRILSETFSGRNTQADLTEHNSTGTLLVRVSGESGSLTGKITIIKSGKR